MKTKHLLSLLILSLCISSCGTSSIEEMKQNIDYKTKEIHALKNYFNEIVPKNYIVRIQYNSPKNIDFFVYEPIPNSQKKQALFGQWNVKLDSYKAAKQTEYEKKHHGKTNSLELAKNRLNWNRETFNNLYQKLKPLFLANLEKPIYSQT